MKVKCLVNNGASFSTEELERMGFFQSTELPLRVGVIYPVYGQMIYKGILKYLVLGSDEDLPSWYPAKLFEVVDSLLYMESYFSYHPGDEPSAIWGFQELANEPEFLYDLIERKNYAIRIFLAQKKEIDDYENKL